MCGGEQLKKPPPAGAAVPDHQPSTAGRKEKAPAPEALRCGRGIDQEGSEQSGDLAVFVHIDLFSGGDLGQTGHGHDVPSEGHQEAGAGGHLYIPDCDSKTVRGAQKALVIREGILRLGHADGQIAAAQLGELLDLLFGGGREDHAVAVIDLFHDGGQLVLNGLLQFIGKAEVVLRLTQTDDLLGQGDAALAALERGLPNLLRHVENITQVYGLPCVVAINRFPTDTEAELKLVEDQCRALGVNVALSEVWAKGGEGGVALAEEVIRLCDAPNHFTFSYELDASIEDKLAAIVTKVYHGDGVVLTPTAQKQAAELTELGFGSLPICMAKTQYSFSDNAALLGAPRGFTITVRNIKVSAGAGFLVALTGDIMTMPGLPKVPAAEKVDVDENGRISGLF